MYRGNSFYPLLTACLMLFGDVVRATSFNVMSFNFFAMKHIISTTGQDDRINGFYETLKANYEKDLDVIIFQEVWSDIYKDMLINQLNSIGYYNTPILNVNHVPQNGGVVIFTKHLPEGIQMYEYKNTRGVDGLAAKGILYVRVSKNDQTFHVFGTHTQSDVDSSKASPDDTGSQATRKLQFLEMQEFIKAQDVEKDDVVIIAGDFNIYSQPNSENLDFLLSMSQYPKDLAATQFKDATFDKVHNKLVGMDGSAKAFGCESSYDDGSNYCSCCLPSHYDYILPFYNHKAPKTNNFTVVPMKTIRPLPICVNSFLARLGRYVSATSPFCSKSILVNHLSDHYAVVGEYVF